MRENGSSGVTALFPSEDGNLEERQQLLKLIDQIVSGVDALKNPAGVNLKGEKLRTEHFYQNLILESAIPQQGSPLEDVGDELLKLLHDHPYHTRYFLTNILPMASTPGILGMITAMLVNGNNLWDVYGPAGAEAEVRVISMMSKLVGYDALRSGGYTTWGGQGAVFTGLRLAIAKFAPEAPRKGVPGNFYAFCSEAAHYSLFKSMEATGIGSDHLIKVRTTADSAMDTDDLRDKLEQVIASGGIPVYIVATTGTTDAMGIDDAELVHSVAADVAVKHGLRRPHIHADSALGGFFAFFNRYDFEVNPLDFAPDVQAALKAIASRMKHLPYADSLCFDFQKLGQTPYLTSLFLVRDAADLQLLDLEPDETPYVGHRGYGQYHTGYTLECSRMASSISIYSALLAFGEEGYQRLLAQLVEVNLAFRRELRVQLPYVEIVNGDNPGIVTLFRIYPRCAQGFEAEVAGRCTLAEIQATNQLNERLFEALGETREQMFFGDTKKHLIVPTVDSSGAALYAAKIFVISPYTETGDVAEIIRHVKEVIENVYEAQETASIMSGR